MRRVNLILGGLLLCSNIRADFISPPMPVPANGEISEKGNKGMQVTITWTGSIPKKGGQVTKLGSVGPYTIANDGGSVDFGVPETSTSSNGVTQPVKDYIQRTVAASEVSGSDPGPVSVLMLEAFVPDPDGTDFDQYGFLDYINGIVGPFVTIWAPETIRIQMPSCTRP